MPFFMCELLATWLNYHPDFGISISEYTVGYRREGFRVEGAGFAPAPAIERNYFAGMLGLSSAFKSPRAYCMPASTCSSIGLMA